MVKLKEKEERGRGRGLERERREKEWNVAQNWCQQMPPMDCVSQGEVPEACSPCVLFPGADPFFFASSCVWLMTTFHWCRSQSLHRSRAYFPSAIQSGGLVVALLALY